MKRAYEETQLETDIGSVEDVMIEIIKASLDNRKLSSWEQCRRLLRKRLVSKKFSVWTEKVFRSVAFLSKNLLSDLSYHELTKFNQLERLSLVLRDSGSTLLSQSTNLKELIICRPIGDDHIQSLTSLEKLHLFGNSYVTDYSLRCLTNLTKLRPGQDSKITMSGIVSCTKLKSLTLDYYQNLVDGLTKLPHLKTLSINNDSVISLEKLRQLTQLTKLKMRGAPSAPLIILEYLTNLTSLSIKARHLSEIDFAMRTRLVKLKLHAVITDSILPEFINLRELKIKGGASFTTGSDFYRLTNLTNLSVCNMSENMHGFETLVNLKKLTHDCHIGCLCLCFMKDLGHLTQLTTLKWRSPITERTEKIINGLSMLTNLRKLVVQATRKMNYDFIEKFPHLKIHIYAPATILETEVKKMLVKRGAIVKSL